MSKKQKRDYIHFLEDIRYAIEKIERYSKDLEFGEFSDNEMVIDAVIRNFEVIGEAVNNIPGEVRDKFPDVEWSEAVGFRNILIHHYFGVDVESIWDTIKINIPGFRDQVEKVLKVESREKPPD